MQTVPQNQDLKTSTPKTEPVKAKPRELAYVAPFVDVYESDAEILLVADVPGVKSADLEIHYEKDTLTFVGKRPDAGVAYKRAFTLPREGDPDAIHAELADGVLKLHLGRHASRRARTIAVKTA
ncbi:MAG: Hsp20/alpha crystallin family protein [Polyangiaceae bacterium]